MPVSEDGSVSPDIYGCDADVFEETYEPSPSLRPNRYRKNETIRAYQPGHLFEIDTVLDDGHVEVGRSRSRSLDAWIALAPGGEAYPIENDTFRNTYVEVQERTTHYRVKTRDEHWAADGTPKRILALDGGGVRGILTLGFLKKIEEILADRHNDREGFRLCHYFDLIAGTSTGAIIAAGLAKGMTVDEVRELYDRLAGSVFRRSYLRFGLLRAKFSAKRLKEHLKTAFTNNTMGSSSLQTGLLVVAKRLDTGSIWPTSNNPGNRWFTAGPNDTYLANEDYPLRSVVRASTAAPSFFAPEWIEISTEGDHPRGEFVDGGVSPHNNPALLALQLVSIAGFGASWSLDPDKLLLTSVGTGFGNPGVAHSLLAGTHAVNSLRALMDDCAESVETMLQWLSNSPTARPLDTAMQKLERDSLAERPLLHYLRYNVQFDRGWLADELGRTMTESEIQTLQKMDRPQNMELLSALGSEAAERQVDE